MTVLLKEAFDEASMLPEMLQDEIAKELLDDIRIKRDNGNPKKLSWEQTYREIAAEKETWDDLKKSKTLELLITPAPACPNKKAKLKKQLALIFKKAKRTKIPGDVDIDALMNEMNDAVL